MNNEEVVKHVNNIPVENISVSTQTSFCKTWPGVKEGLLVLNKILPAMTFLINLVIAAGDALTNRICR